MDDTDHQRLYRPFLYLRKTNKEVTYKFHQGLISEITLQLFLYDSLKLSGYDIACDAGRQADRRFGLYCKSVRIT